MSVDDNRNTSHYLYSEHTLVVLQKCRYCEYTTDCSARGMDKLAEHVLVKHGLRRGNRKSSQNVDNGNG